MAQSRLPMRKIRDVLRLSAAGLSKRQIAASLGIGPTAAGACLRRAREAGLGWPLPDDLDDDALERRLYPPAATPAKDWRSLPDWPAVHRELRRKGVTLQLVWEEYRAVHPDGYGRSRFCELYRAWEGRLSPTMRQAHVAGEKLFVDYAGTTIDIVDAATGEVHACQLFVAALGASSMTYAEATLHADAARLDRLAHARVRVLRRRAGDGRLRQSEVRHHQGVLLRAGRQPRLCRDGDALRHRDRAGAADEAARQGEGRGRRAGRDALDHRQAAQCQVLLAGRAERRHPRLRHGTQRSRLPASRRQPPRAVRGGRGIGAEAAAGRDLTSTPNGSNAGPGSIITSRSRSTTTRCRTRCCARRCGRGSPRARSSCSIAATASPCTCAHRRTASTRPCASTCRRAISAMPIGRRSASSGRPPRSGRRRRRSSRLILREKTHPEQGFRATIGIIRHAKSFGPERLEAACDRALEIGARSYTSVTSILKNNLDRRRPAPATDGPAIVHANIRGPRYFH